MTTPADQSSRSEQRELAPIRWPHPGRGALVLVAIWVLGMLLAVFVPALIVSPGQDSAPLGDVLAALACTFAGAGVMLAVGLVFHRRHADPVATAFGVVPAITVVVGGLIMAAVKLSG